MTQSNAALDVSESHLSQRDTTKGGVGPVAAQSPRPVIQRLFVMRHGERLDTREPGWARTAVRPYDTPITGKGKLEAFRLAQKLFTNKDITIVYSSPFLRCLQTAQQASSAIGVEGLCVSKHLSEILTRQCGMKTLPEVPCEDIESYDVNIKQHDSGGFPTYPETAKEADQRYTAEFSRLADLHWPQNLLLVTHECGVMSAMALGGCTDSVEATYCGSVQLSRRDQTRHEWTIEQYHGVYKYENI